MSNFHSLKVVGRGSETQLQVSGNLNCITCHFNGKNMSQTKQMLLSFIEYFAVDAQ